MTPEIQKALIEAQSAANTAAQAAHTQVICAWIAATAAIVAALLAAILAYFFNNRLSRLDKNLTQELEAFKAGLQRDLMREQVNLSTVLPEQRGILRELFRLFHDAYVSFYTIVYSDDNPVISPAELTDANDQIAEFHGFLNANSPSIPPHMRSLLYTFLACLNRGLASYDLQRTEEMNVEERRIFIQNSHDDGVQLGKIFDQLMDHFNTILSPHLPEKEQMDKGKS